MLHEQDSNNFYNLNHLDFLGSEWDINSNTAELRAALSMADQDTGDD